MSAPRSLELPFAFSSEQRALGERLGAELSDDDVALHDPKRVARRLADLGLFELVVPNDDEKVSVVSLCVAREALGYTSPLADSVLAVQGLGAHPIVLARDWSGRHDVLGRARRGEIVLGFGLTEPDAGSDVASMRTQAELGSGGITLDGDKTFISNVGIADAYSIFAVAKGEGVDASLPAKKRISAFFVSTGSKGLTQRPIELSVEHPIGKLEMRGCAIERDRLIGEVGKGLRLALGTLDVFRTSVGAAAVGMAQRALDESVRRAASRRQFGKPIGEFQLTQAILAEMATELDAARLLVYRAAFSKDAGNDSTKAVAMAKMYATEVAFRIIDHAVQIHGGLGVVVGTIVERLYREIRPLRIYEGTTEIQKLIIGSALVREASG